MTDKLRYLGLKSDTEVETPNTASVQPEVPLILAFIDKLGASSPEEKTESLETLHLVVAFLLQKGVPLQGILSMHLPELPTEGLNEETMPLLLDLWLEEFSETAKVAKKEVTVVGLAKVRSILIQRASVLNHLAEMSSTNVSRITLTQLPNPRRRYLKNNVFVITSTARKWIEDFRINNKIDLQLLWQSLLSTDGLRTSAEREETARRLEEQRKKEEQIEEAKKLRRMFASNGFSTTEPALPTPASEVTPITEKKHLIKSWLERIDRDWYIVNSTKQSFIPVAEMFKFFKEQGIPLPDGVQSKDDLIKIVEAMKGETTVQGTVVNKMCIHGYEVGYPHGGSYIKVIERKNVETVLEQLVPEL